MYTRWRLINGIRYHRGDEMERGADYGECDHCGEWRYSMPRAIEWMPGDLFFEAPAERLAA